MKKQNLPSSAEGGFEPLEDTVVIDGTVSHLRFAGFSARVFSGANDALAYEYAVGQRQSKWAIETAMLYPSSDGKIYGVWARIFWGRSNELPPPLVNIERFVLEKIVK